MKVKKNTNNINNNKLIPSYLNIQKKAAKMIMTMNGKVKMKMKISMRYNRTTQEE
jgi:hypothetical protein